MPRDAVSRTAHVGTVGTNGLIPKIEVLTCDCFHYVVIIKQSSDFNDPFPIELAPNGILFGAKSIGNEK